MHAYIRHYIQTHWFCFSFSVSVPLLFFPMCLTQPWDEAHCNQMPIWLNGWAIHIYMHATHVRIKSVGGLVRIFMLLRRHPGSWPDLEDHALITTQMHARCIIWRRGLPEVEQKNKHVSPGVEAIVLKGSFGLNKDLICSEWRYPRVGTERQFSCNRCSTHSVFMGSTEHKQHLFFS